MKIDFNFGPGIREKMKKISFFFSTTLDERIL
jgi:hypothetical protein